VARPYAQDNRAIIRAASKAGKAADWLLGFAPAADDGQTPGIAPDASSRAA
jgi:antirestriction protein ArdC